MNDDRIEISTAVDLMANIAFWIDRKEWEMLSADEKRAEILSRIKVVNISLDNDVVRFAGANLVATIMAPDGKDKPVDLTGVEIYDPKEGL